MDGPSHRMWMYHRIDKHTGELRDEFISGVEEFDSFARSQQEFIVNNVYRCLCAKCNNAKYLTPNVMKLHLHGKGFAQHYCFCTSHGEVNPNHYEEGTSFDREIQVNLFNHNHGEDAVGIGDNEHHMETMLNDAFRFEENSPMPGHNVNVKSFCNTIQSA